MHPPTVVTSGLESIIDFSLLYTLGVERTRSNCQCQSSPFSDRLAFATAPMMMSITWNPEGVSLACARSRLASSLRESNFVLCQSREAKQLSSLPILASTPLPFSSSSSPSVPEVRSTTVRIMQSIMYRLIGSFAGASSLRPAITLK